MAFFFFWGLYVSVCPLITGEYIVWDCEQKVQNPGSMSPLDSLDSVGIVYLWTAFLGMYYWDQCLIHFCKIKAVV